MVELADVNLEATEGISIHMFVFPPLLEEKEALDLVLSKTVSFCFKR